MSVQHGNSTKSEREHPSSRLDAIELGRFRALLEREHERLTRRLARHEADLSVHRGRVAQRDPCAILSPATATEDAEQEVRAWMANETANELAAVATALRRLEESPEGFGVCEPCGRFISTARLEVLPHSAVCEQCAGNADDR